MQALFRPQAVISHGQLLVRNPQGQVVGLPVDSIRDSGGDTFTAGDAVIPKAAILSTDGNLASTSAWKGAGSGGIQGGMALGLSASTLATPDWLPGLLGGLVGGYAGVREGERTQSLEKALETGAAGGALASLGATAALLLAPAAAPAAGLAMIALTLAAMLAPQPLKQAPEALGQALGALGKLDDRLHGHLAAAGLAAAGAAALALTPELAPVLGVLGLVGGLAGAAGTVSANRLSDLRDREHAGFLAGSVGASVLGAPPLSLAVGVGSALGSPGQGPLKQAALAFTGSALSGAALGLAGGPQTALLTGLVAGLGGVLGTLAGPPLMQAVRNLSGAPLTNLLDRTVGKLIAHPTPAGRVALAVGSGAVMGGMAAGAAVPIFGPAALAVGVVGGALYFGIKASKGDK